MSSNNVTELVVAPSSRMPGFHRLSPAERRERLTLGRWLEPSDRDGLEGDGGLDEDRADAMIENVVGLHALPLGVALNFTIDGRDRLVPMAVEEPSIVAACSYAAKLARDGGGFTVSADAPIVTAQIELLEVPDTVGAAQRLTSGAAALVAAANELIPRMVERGGGATEVEVRVLGVGHLVVHVHVDCRDAMGANTVNAIAEGLGPRVAALSGGRVGLRILTNLADRRKVRVTARIPLEALTSQTQPDGAVVRDAILEAQRFAEVDSYRAVTHNKGVMNGVDAVLVATGNDWRAVEAGAHAWASRSGRYGPLTRWWTGEDGALEGELELPLATSTVGGAALAHPGVKRALRLAKVDGARDLAGLAAAAGLASNLAALKALATEGIQRGHMSLHARRVAVEAGAVGELIDLVAAQLARESVYRQERAGELLRAFQRQAVP